MARNDKRAEAEQASSEAPAAAPQEAPKGVSVLPDGTVLTDNSVAKTAVPLNSLSPNIAFEQRDPRMVVKLQDGTIRADY